LSKRSKRPSREVLLIRTGLHKPQVIEQLSLFTTELNLPTEGNANPLPDTLGDKTSAHSLPNTIRRLENFLNYLSGQNHPDQNHAPMLYFIMYDIAENKVRTAIAKYLIAEGALRVQKSVYLIRGSKAEIDEISETLHEINSQYTNEDSILVLPVPRERLDAMRVIGRNFNYDMIVKPPNMLFF
jgi:CRISPR-associated endonuclease Cas2